MARRDDWCGYFRAPIGDSFASGRASAGVWGRRDPPFRGAVGRPRRASGAAQAHTLPRINVRIRTRW